MEYKIIDRENYYRKDIFRHFTEDCRCSTSITNDIDVTALVEYSKKSGTKFYINFLYLIAKALNSREDYRLGYLYDKNELVLFDKINPAHYVFHQDTETFTVVYTEYDEDYSVFYQRCSEDIAKAKQTREYGLDSRNHINYFDASYISWISYNSLNIELPDGYLYFQPISNWGRYKYENGRYMMPCTLRMNHAVGDGYHISAFFVGLEKLINEFCEAKEISKNKHKLNLVLVEPQIPQNTGNISRTCAVTGAVLHLVKPYGFEITDKHLKRAGLDYWDKLEIHQYENMNEFFEKNKGEFYFFTTKGRKVHSEVSYPEDKEVYLIFGREDKGLPEDLLYKNPDKCVRIPMRNNLRSLNLSNSVAIAVYETLRQWDYPDLGREGKLTQYTWDE